MGALQDENARDVAESLELRVSVYHRGEETDVLVRAMSSDRIGRLAEKLGAKTVGGASLGVWCARRGNRRAMGGSPDSRPGDWRANQARRRRDHGGDHLRRALHGRAV
jgi:hypothetical protein